MNAVRVLVRILGWSAAALGAVSVLLMALLYFAIATTPGARMVAHWTGVLLPSLSVEAVNGTLRGPLVLEGFAYEIESMRVRADSVHIDWRLRDLLRRRLSIRRLFVSGTELVVTSQESSATEASDPSRDTLETLPVKLFLGRLRMVDLDVRAPGELSLSDAHVSASGQPGDYQLELEGRLHAPRIGRGQLRLFGNGDLEGLEVEQARLHALDGDMRASGSLSWWPDLSWSVALRADSIAPAPALPQRQRWPGHVTFAGHSSGGLSTGSPQIDLRVDTLFGRLRDRRIAARAELHLDTAHLIIPNLRLRWGAAHARASGTLSAQLNLSFSARIPDLALALPGANGSATVEGSLSGSRAGPRLSARFAAEGIAYRGDSVDSLRGTIDAGLTRAPAGSLRVTARGLSVSGQRVDGLEILTRGNRAEHTLRSRAQSPHGQVEIALSGGLSDTVWSGHLRQATLANERAGRWRLLDDPVPLEVSPSSARLVEPLCLTSGAARLCANGEWRSGAGWQASAGLEAVPLALIGPLLPAGWTVTGDVNGSARITWSAGSSGPLVNADLEPGPGTVTFPVAGRTSRLRYDSATLRARTGPDGAAGMLRLVLSEPDSARVGTLRAEARLPEYDFGDTLIAQDVNGRLVLRLQNLSPVDALLPRIAELGGSAALEVTVDGTLRAPRVLGEARLRDARVDVPELGLELRQITVTATGDEEGRVALRGSMRSGTGRIDVEGESPLQPRADDPSRLKFEGERFLAVNTHRTRLLASPAIELEFDGTTIHAEGDLEIPAARIRLREPSGTHVPISDDVVLVDSAGAPRSTPFAVSARVRVTLGDSVSVSGYGFDGRIAGGLVVIEAPDDPTRGSGTILVEEGSYSAFGQTLQIEQGELIFAGGPVNNPGLDIRATRVTDDSVTVGVLVGGTVRSPVVTLFSDPPMPHDQILARLATGQGLADAGDSDGDALEAARRKLGVKGANLLLDRIAAGLALDEAEIESEGGLENAALLVGKYLSPRIYMAYGAGLFDPLRTIQIRYFLSSRWTLTAETGDATSADVLYEIEIED